MTDGDAGGVNQRAAIRMSSDEIDEFVATSRTMTMCTINHDGTIHAVAMWYGLLDGAVVVTTKAKAQKVRNLRRNTNLTVLIEDGESYDQLRGVELVGSGEVIDDPARVFQAGVSLFSRYQTPYEERHRPQVEASMNKRVAIRLDVRRTVSWDHRKLASPSA